MKIFSTALVLIASGLALLAADSKDVNPAVPPEAAKFLGLFDRLRAADDLKATGRHGHVSFQISEDEINQYMKYSLAATPRPGLESVSVKVFAKNYVSVFAVIDFDALERWKPGTVPALLKPVLIGRKSVCVDYRFEATDAKGSFTVEKALYQDLPLPAFAVERMIAILAARQPEKYDTSKPLTLPFGLRRVWTAEHAVAGEN